MSGRLQIDTGTVVEIRIKRVYAEPDAGDGTRILVDRLWPRGLTKDAARIDLWAKDISPSNELRRWYGHDPGKWAEFKRRYFAELAARPQALSALMEHIDKGPVTFVFGSKETRLNNAVALKEYVLSARRNPLA